MSFKKKKSLQEFLNEVFPYETTFERKHFGFFTNFIKHLALRTAYLLYLLNISANALTIFSVFLTIPCFYLLYEGLNNSKFYFLLSGYMLICVVLFIDFVDGSLSKISDYIYVAGDSIDNLPPDIIRIGSIIFFGILTKNNLFILLSFVSSMIIVLYVPNTIKNIQVNRNWLKILFTSRMAIVNFRVIFLLIMPLVLISFFFNPEIGTYLSLILIFTYFCLSIIWIFFSLEDKQMRDKDTIK